MDISQELNVKDFGFDVSFTSNIPSSKQKTNFSGDISNKVTIQTQKDTLQNLFHQWGVKLEQLEMNIQDVENVKKQVTSTLEKARIRKSVDDKENMKSLSNTNKEVSYVSQKYEYNNYGDADHSVDLNSSKEKISLHLETVATQKILVEQRPIGDFLIKAKADNYINNFLDLGVYDTQSLLERIGNDENLDKNLIKIFGVDKIGKRKSIILQMMEELGEYERLGLLKLTNQIEFEELPSIDEWLESVIQIFLLNLLQIDKSQYLNSFLDAGYDDFEKLMMIQTSELQIKNPQELALEISVKNIDDLNKIFESLNEFKEKVLNFNFQKSEQIFNKILKKDNIDRSQGCSGKNIGCSINQISGNCKIF